MQNRIRTFLKQTTILTSLAMGWVAVVQPANANPEGGQVVAGSATISNPDPSTLLIEQDTDRAVINWGSFNIAAGETTQFVVPDAESWTLNRVVGTQSPSLIYGSILSNGNVVIVNPDGMLFGAGATVDVNRLIATTADIGNGDFMAGRLTFGKPGKPSASIVNLGTISAADYGLAALVAPSVRNSGIITARLGTVALAAGNSFTIDPYGDGLIKLAIGDEVSAEVFDVATGEAVSNLVQNDGTLSANGGTVAMTAATARRAVDAVINTTGVVEARSVGVRNGMIVLGAGTTATKPSEAPVQAVKVSGTLDATGTDPNNEWPLGTEVTGGRIEITGEAILATDATIDASGRNGGGTVLIGGDYLGGNIDAQEAVGLGVELEDREVDTASLVVLDETVTISADATQIGDGGKVIVWSDDVTLTAAEITARGGAESGDGGFIETSGKNYLSVLAAADASATNGLVGTWLMDPVNIRIVDGPDQYADVQDNYYFGQFPVDGILVDVYGRLITPVDQYTLTPDGLGGFIRNDVHSSDSIIDSATIEAALNSGTSVFITNINSLGDDPGTISIEADINKTGGGDVMLNFNAASDIYIADGVDITNSSGRMILYFVTHGGGVYAPNMGTIDLGPGEGQLLLAARDGGVIRSSGSIPYAIQFDQWVVPAATGSWNVRFAGGDRIGYDITPGYVTFGTDAINLTGSQMGLSFILGQDVRVYDNAIFVDNQSSIAWLFVDDPDASMAGATISNNIPEIASDGVLLAGWRSSTNVDVGGWLNTFPVLEVAEGMNPATQCGGITCVPVTPVVVPQVVVEPQPMVLEVSTDRIVLVENLCTIMSSPDCVGSYMQGFALSQTQSLERNLVILKAAADLKSYYSAANEIYELLRLYKDAKAARDFIAEYLIPATGDSDIGKLFQRKAGISIYKSSVKILAELFLESALQAGIQRFSPIEIDDNVAESLTKTLLNVATADLTGQIIDQGLLIAQAFSDIQKQNLEILQSVHTSLLSTVKAARTGRIPMNQAVAAIGLSKDLSYDLAANSPLMNREVAIRIMIIAAMADIALLERTVRSDNLAYDKVNELRVAILRLSGTRPGLPINTEYFNFANQMALDFGVSIW